MRRREFEAEIQEVLQRAGASDISFSNGGKHPDVRFAWQGARRRYCYPKTPSDCRSYPNSLSQLRRLLRGTECAEAGHARAECAGAECAGAAGAPVTSQAATATHANARNLAQRRRAAGNAPQPEVPAPALTMRDDPFEALGPLRDRLSPLSGRSSAGATRGREHGENRRSAEDFVFGFRG